MVLTNEEKAVLLILVEKELEMLRREGKKLFISNSPFLGKISRDEPDIPFLKSEAKYEQFLKRLRKRV